MNSPHYLLYYTTHLTFQKKLQSIQKGKKKKKKEPKEKKQSLESDS